MLSERASLRSEVEVSLSLSLTFLSMELDLEKPIPTTAISYLFQIESDQNPSKNNNDLNNNSIRSETISLIKNFSCNYQYSVSYLAINYLDRFLSTRSVPVGKPWVLRLMAISFVSLAMKMMRKTECSVSDLQHAGSFIFDAQTICRMEKLILGALKWRMRSITPFSFINFFITLFKFKEDPPLVHALKARATEIIFKAQNDFKMLVFKPSLIAASALLCACHELFPLQFPCFKEAISTCEYVNKDKMYRCYNMMQEIAMDGYESVLEIGAMSGTYTPVNILDLNFSSSSSSTTTNVRSYITSSSEAEATNKLDDKQTNNKRSRKTTTTGAYVAEAD